MSFSLIHIPFSLSFRPRSSWPTFFNIFFKYVFSCFLVLLNRRSRRFFSLLFLFVFYPPRTETESDVEVRVSLPPETPAKHVQLSVTKTSLTLGLKGREGPVLKARTTTTKTDTGKKSVLVVAYIHNQSGNEAINIPTNQATNQ